MTDLTTIYVFDQKSVVSHRELKGYVAEIGWQPPAKTRARIATRVI